MLIAILIPKHLGDKMEERDGKWRDSGQKEEVKRTLVEVFGLPIPCTDTDERRSKRSLNTSSINVGEKKIRKK